MGHPRLLFLYFRSFQTILFYEALSFVVTIGVTFCFTVIGATIWCLILGVAILVSFWEQTLLVLRLDNYATTVIIVVIDAPVVTGVAVEVVVVVLLCSGVHSNEEKEWDFYSKDSHRWMTTQMSHFSSFRRFSFFLFSHLPTFVSTNPTLLAYTRLSFVKLISSFILFSSLNQSLHSILNLLLHLFRIFHLL